MEQSKPAISQKEYLKRYLMKDKDKKIKKKKKQAKVSSSTHQKRSVIIDDDININEVPRLVDDEFTLDHLGDEAPQIVGIVDERPEQVKLAEKYESGKWRPVGAEGEKSTASTSGEQLTKDDLWGVQRGTRAYANDDLDLSRPRLNHKYEKESSHKRRSDSRKNESDSDIEVPRQRRRREKDRKDQKMKAEHSDVVDTDRSTARREKGNVDKDFESKLFRRSKSSKDEDDFYPKRNKQSRDTISRRRGSSDSDQSPPRKHGGNKYVPLTRHGKEEKESHRSPPRRKRGGSDSDLSPPSRKKRGSSSDLSPPRKNKDGNSSDLSPPRRKKDSNNSDLSPLRRKNAIGDSDLSPPRRSRKDRKERSLPQRRNSPTRKYKNGSDSDLELPRAKKDLRDAGISPSKTRETYSKKRKGCGDADQSPSARHGGGDSDLSPPRRRRGGSDSDLSPPRRKESHSKKDILGRKPEEKVKSDKMQDGKKAGLQDAKSLKDELRILKEKEDEMFRQMDPELLGRSTVAVVRDRKTGLKRDFEKEREIERQKAAKDAVRQKKYEKWGKGLKQVQEQEERVADMMHEMSKPLARYADDDDLEKALKAQEREGDPMLDYIRRHQKESHTIDLTVGGMRKKYQGSYLPNRFNIPPGHRWDGVDRSNGYEQRWFEARNSKKATAEEAWKWSSADM